ncbi:helix-turn-helix domain-containing protein [Pedobacter nutrimenti]|uniref:helix-turn-helix domain-containing protein n=1 Tax=Pedobacter nutrimenti TaxID=1241337 RepID=UPI00292F7E22|nr:helix-turn-helix domain-containing protein [Pedobacter nutrimenti]
MLIKAILFTGFVQGFFQILLLGSKTRNALADKWLMAWLLLVSFQLLFYYDGFSGAPVATGYIGVLAFSIPLLSAPMLYQYIRSLSFGKNLTTGFALLYFLPVVFYWVVNIWFKFHYGQEIEVLKGYPHFDPEVPGLVLYIFTIPMAIIPGGYAIWGLITLIRYQSSLSAQYSYTEKITLNWLKWLVISILVLFIGLFLLIRFGRIALGPDDLFSVVGAVLSGYIFLIGYLGIRQGTVLIGIEKDILPEPAGDAVPYRNSGLDERAVEKIYGSLIEHMETQHPYLSDDLSLSALAAQLNVSPNQLSQVINQRSGSNFFTFVNAYRVQAVKVKLLDPAFAHLSILGIAFECGFKSKSAFNRIFKEQVGSSPLEYQRQEKL